MCDSVMGGSVPGPEGGITLPCDQPAAQFMAVIMRI